MWDANHPSNGQTAPASTVFGYDALDRQTTITQPWGGTGGGTTVVQLEYDVQDHLSKVTDGEGGVTTFETSDRDLQIREVSEVSGETTFAYNEHGVLEEKTDARGVTVTYTNDALDRTTFDDYPGTELDITRVSTTNRWCRSRRAG